MPITLERRSNLGAALAVRHGLYAWIRDVLPGMLAQDPYLLALVRLLAAYVKTSLFVTEPEDIGVLLALSVVLEKQSLAERGGR
jgi:hypothetical protein